MTVKNRVARLEKMRLVDKRVPPYLSVADMDEYDRLVTSGQPLPYRIYIGISPDDWDDDEVGS